MELLIVLQHLNVILERPTTINCYNDFLNACEPLFSESTNYSLIYCTIPFIFLFKQNRSSNVYMYNTLHLTGGHLPSSLYWKVSRFFKVPYSKEHSPILVTFASILKHVLFLDRPYLSLQFLHIIFIIIVILLMQVLASFLGISKLNDTEKEERKKERKKD